ncbi:MAG TPA: hypothetical protein VHN99_08875 [Deinococcales bacterium]|nr:hypothetical protein [Deinococcales bacterium]
MTPPNPFLTAAERVARGQDAGLSFQARALTGWCAQLAADLARLALPQPWPLARRAWTVAFNAGRRTPWALDYAQAARDLGRARPGGQPAQPGDLLFRTGPAAGCREGHVAVLLSAGRVLENTTANRGTPVRPGSAIRVTPLKACPKPTLAARP